MPTWDVGTGTRGASLRLIADLVATDAPGRRSQWRFRLQVLNVPTATFIGEPADACSISWPGGRIDSSFTWASGTTSKTLIDTTQWIAHNANGSMSGSVTGAIAATGTTGIGGPTTNGPRALSFPTLTVPPNTPTGCSAARTSDTSVTVSWSQSHPSNGGATTNTVRRRINGGAWANAATISPANSTILSAAANQKIEYAVNASNGAGTSAWSNTSPAVYTSPAAPTAVSATKDAALDITIGWTPNVAFVEHQHQVEVSTDGGTTWSLLATVAAGTSTFKHVDPDPAFVHVYRVRARNTAAGNLTSAWSQSNSVQLLAPPNAPSLANLPTFADKAADLLVTWTHNPVDTTPQTAYEVEFSTDGGATYSTTGKVTSAVSQRVFAANTYAANDQLTVRVRTWGEATTGGADGAGASPWSTIDTVTFKTRPVVSILSPADASVWEEAALTVGLGFSQAEGASFVQATIVLSQGATVLETLQSNTLAATTLGTTVVNGGAYTLTVTAVDSNGIVSAAVVADFTVAYTPPVAAAVQLEYLDESGVVQVGIAVPDPLDGEAAAVAVSVMRSVDGGPFETLLASYPLDLPTPNSVQLSPNVFTNPSFEAASGTVSTPEGVQPVPVGVVNDGEPTIWQSDTRAVQGMYSAAFYWPPEPIFPGDDLFPDDDVFPG